MRGGNVLFLGVALLLMGGAGRLAYIEYAQGPQLRQRAQRQQTSEVSIPAQRGSILDTRGRVLAGSRRRPSIFVDPALVADPAHAANCIAPALGLHPGQLERIIREHQDRRFVWVKRQITDAELAAFNEVRRSTRLHAFVVRHEPERVYPLARLASHVLGFVGAEQHGLAGIEQTFDDVLRGSAGRRRSTVDVRRRRIRIQKDDYVPPRDGANVVLTIDSHVQQRTEHHLRNAVEQFRAEWGTAVVMAPGSGEVLAMATYPDYDPSEPFRAGLNAAQREAAQECIRNRAVSDSYEPGSLFKPFIASCALDDGLTTLSERFAINGPTHSFGRRTIHDTHTYGTLSMSEVISKSSNIGMGLLGARCTNERLHEYVRRFGFGDLTGVSLPGEHTGLVQDLARWTGYSTQSIPIGQEIGVTPIQIVTAFSALCNGGVLYRPRVVRGVVSANGTTLSDYSRPVAIRRVLSPATAREFRMRALVAVVNDGTGKPAALADYQVFGKTGTAQVARPNGRGYLPGKYAGSFMAGAPADEPRAAVLVSLYKPAGGDYYGSKVAAPAAGAILADTLAYMQVPPELASARVSGQP
ncbi:MAG: penicillin-binding protein 2 [Planctomycetes bacterium]|nr:penicillin-binding protein 2 [Planctomycetota bacterium]